MSDTPDAMRSRPDRTMRVLDDPVVALLPWFAFTFLLGPLTFAGASLVAFGLSCLLVAAALFRGRGARAFEVSDAVLFGLIVVVALVHDPASESWLSDHADAVSNVVLTLIAFASLAIRKPFTSQYTAARFAGAPPRLLARLDRVSTSIWAFALLAASLVAVYGEWILDQQSNLWTAWILQTVPLIVALDLTLWMGRRALAGVPDPPGIPPPPVTLVRDLSAWLVPIGALSLIFDGGPPGFGWALIAIGTIGTAAAWVELSRRTAMAT